ncbi:Histone chaperone asf1 [Taxawa tesnikishii (nom. ined.)]|nr:Histone chaperone asf1 [Dothideales sp. JES 119]
MATVSLLNVAVRNNPAPFNAPYEFEITFECLEPLSKDLEWKLTYVGSATSSEHDQELDSLLVGPIPVGVNKFVFEADAPDLSKIPNSEILGVTVILLTCSYDGREFVRVGYYVNNEYTDEALNAEPPAKPIIEKVRRNILAEKPRVTRFGINGVSPEQPDADAAEDDGAMYGAEEEEEDLAEEAEAAKVEGEDADMAGAGNANGHTKEDDEVSEAGSEDLEAESSGSEDEDEEEDLEGEGEAEGEGAADEDMEMGEGHEGAVPVPPIAEQQPQQQQQQQQQQHQPDVMVH